MITDNLKKYNITIPDAPDPVGAYVAYKVVGKLLYISGQLPIGNNGKIIKGKKIRLNLFNIISFASLR